jgi:hypothetical protein
VDHLFLQAIERAAGRAGEPATEPSPEWLAFARRILKAARRVEALPACPASALRRAATVPDLHPRRSLVAALWSLAFDSLAQPAPAARGGAGPRLVRFGGLGGTLDIEVVPAEGEALVLRGTVDGPAGPLHVEAAPARGVPLRAPVGAGGAFVLALPEGGRWTLSLLAGRRTLARMPALDLRA